jgi:capsular polysaccharide export protein
VTSPTRLSIDMPAHGANAPLVVLLQGPVGPFFKRFAERLRERGHRVLKVDFNIGDAWQSRRSSAFLFRDTSEQWQIWFRNFLTGHRPKCVVLFGDQRIYHRHAIAACKDHNVDVWCIEEGYIRPNYVTFERGGNSAASALATSWDDGKTRKLKLPTPIEGNGFRAMAKAAVPYYVVNALLRWHIDNYTHHRNRPLLTEGFFWLRNAYRKWRRRIENAHTVLELLERHNKKFFVAALQVYDDLSVTTHGRGWSNERLIEAAILSFAANAEHDDVLVIKCHPLDRGHCTYDVLVREMAEIAGVRDRVRLIDDGPLGLLLRHARGIVNINSTSGILGLRVGCPVFVLGNAIYRHPELSQFGDVRSLDAFWRNPIQPDAATVDRFLNRLIEDTQINGSLYQPEYFAMTIDAMIDRISATRPPRLRTY